MLKADYDFLALQREMRVQAQFVSDISDISSQPELEEDDIDEIEKIPQDEICRDELGSEISVEIEKIKEEPRPIMVDPKQKQEESLELLKSAFELIKRALSLLDDQNSAGSQNFKQEIETVSQSLAPIMEKPVCLAATEPVVQNSKETFASKIKKSVASKAAEPVASKAAEPVASKAAEPVASKAAGPVASKAAEPVASKAAEPVASKAAGPVASKAAEPVASKVKKPVASKAAGPVASKAAEPVASKAAEPVASKAAEPVASKAAEPVASKAAEPVASKAVESDVSKVTIKQDDFQVVMPKKSKNKNATIVVSTEVEHKDEFPSLGSSFSPVQKTGFWGSGKSSLEIAKSVAKIPSPPPTRSPSLNNSNKLMRASAGSRGTNDGESDYSDEEFKLRKHGGSDDKDGDDYWQ
jgi:hypothetical protein